MPASWPAPAAKRSTQARSSLTGRSRAPSPASTPSTTSSRSGAPRSETGPLAVPARSFLVGVRQPQEPRLVEGPSHRLEGQGQSRCREPTRDREGGQPIPVERSGEAGEPRRASVEGLPCRCLERSERGRRLGGDRRQEHVDLVEDLADEGARQSRAETERLQIVVGGDGEPNLEPCAHRRLKRLRLLTQDG